MRILLMHHFPLAGSLAGAWVERFATALVAAGHEARLLIVDSSERANEPWLVDRVICRDDDPRAELPFDIPRFSSESAAAQGRAFHEISTEELARYRERLRRHLDAHVDRFDPHVIHAQHIWLQGQLAVETGVPYVLNAWGPELDDYHLDVRIQPLADQAAANAGRILAPDEATLGRVAGMFELEPQRALVMSRELTVPAESDSPASRSVAADQLVRLYQALVDERFGNAS